MVGISLIIIAGGNTEEVPSCLKPVSDIMDETSVIDITVAEDKAVLLNSCFNKASSEYVMWLYSDDLLDDINLSRLIEIKQNLDSSIDGVNMLHQNFSDSKDNDVTTLRRNHIVKKAAGFTWENGLSLYLPAHGNIIDSDIVINCQNSSTAVRKYPGVVELMLETGRDITDNDKYYYACKLLENGLNDKAASYFELFLDSTDGWVGDKLDACYKLSDIYNKQGSSFKEKQAIIRGFSYDQPRAEFFCKMGSFYLETNEPGKAIAWYKAATLLNKPADNLGFIKEECWSWLPLTQLCVCCHRLGEYQQAYEYNELALQLMPENETLLNNKNLLYGLLNKNKPDFKTPSINISKSLRKPLRIVQVAPGVYPVPPDNYGGTEVVIYELTEELVKRGFEVILYAQEGSRTSARLIPYKQKSMLNSIEIMKYVTETLPDRIDIFHYHTYPSFISSKSLSCPVVCTVHSPINAITMNPVYVSKRALEIFGGNKGYYVYNGLDFSRYEFSEAKEDYLLFIGRIDKEKGLHHAVEVSEKTNQKLIISGPIHDYDYFNSLIAQKLGNNPDIHYIGPVGGKKKQELIKHARCLLFPINWEEPFGLVMIEAMACGTPVLAFECGSVPEVLNGFPRLICKNTDEMVYKLLKQKLPDPYMLRRYVSDNFSASIMADRYIEIYEKLINENR